MGDPEGGRLFLSYGRTDATALADRLAQDLVNHAVAGHPHYATWVDRSKLRGGAAWSEQIVAALRTVRGVVAILTPHSVRTHSDAADSIDSVCLDEISFARFAAHKPIVPAMAIPCEPPFEIYRLQYVDFTNWNDEAEYRRAFAELLDALNTALAGRDRYRGWDERLQPWDFSAFLARKRAGFTGRAWLFDEVRDWSDAGAEPALLVVGGPGIGKSAIVAELVHRNPDGRVLAYHCCQANVPETLRPGRFVRSIAAMIASRHPAYEALLETSPYRELLTRAACDDDPESAFELGVLSALEQAGAPGAGRRLLVVDALDEALLVEDEPVSIVDLIADRIDRFPSWLGVIATSREEDDVLDALALLTPRVLQASDPANLRDLEAYVQMRLATTALADRVAASRRDAGWVTRTLLAAAQGNFLFAQQALDAVAAKRVAVEDLAQLTPGLAKQYAWFFERQYEKTWPSVAPLFEAFVAAQAPLAEAELVAATGLEGATFARAMADITQYLRSEGKGSVRWELFHRSLVEWLTDAKRIGRPYSVSTAAGHQRLATGLFARYEANRLELSDYQRRHLARHLSEAARAAGDAQRPARLEQLTRFVLDDVVQQQRVEDPLGMNADFAMALATVTAGAAANAVVLACETALGWHHFRRERLDAGRLFELAREGRLDAVEQELSLYQADAKWAAAARLVAAWLAKDVAPEAADDLRTRTRTAPWLDERVDAAFEQRAANVPPIDRYVDEQVIADIFRNIGATDDEPVNPSMVWDQAEPPPSGAPGAPDPEGTRYLAEFDAPAFVALVQKDRDLGTRRLREYIALNAANAYRVYRNGSLWEILHAVSRHDDAAWVRDMVPPIVAAALAGADREVMAAIPLTVLALRAQADPAGRIALEERRRHHLDAAANLEPTRGYGDSWGEHRRSLCALAEAQRLLLGESVDLVVDAAVGIPPGYAGFQGPASLTLAETLAVCGADPARIDNALREASVAAQNVQDLVFCARSVSRVRGLADIWWKKPAPNAVELAAWIEDFRRDPHTREFAARHVVRDPYPDRRRVTPTAELPRWLREANTLASLARAFQWPLAEFLRLNPEYADAEAAIPDDAVIRVPDPRWHRFIAAWLAARVLHTPGLSPDERVRLILGLVPSAAAAPTELATVLARLLLAAAPSDGDSIKRLDAACEQHIAAIVA